MKKVLSVLCVATLTLSLVACGKTEAPASVEPEVSVSEEVSVEASIEEPVVEVEPAMTYAEYVAADFDTDVEVEFTVQAHQSWWDGKVTVYGADEDGAYFVYNMACSEEDAAKLDSNPVIRVKGTKTQWSGEVELAEGATFEFVDGAVSYIAPAKDATDLLGLDGLAELQNQLVSFTDMEVTAVSYKNEQPGDDIYVNLKKGDYEYYFCLEYYLNGSDAEFYDLVGNLEVGSIVDVEAYLYWYEGPNGHLTKVTVK